MARVLSEAIRAKMRGRRGPHGAKVVRRNLYDARRAASMTQSDVGARIEKTGAHYGKFELGRVDLSAREALTLCDLFGLTIQQLFDQ